MSDFFLKIKDWQFFLLIYVLPYVFLIVLGLIFAYSFFQTIDGMEQSGGRINDPTELFAEIQPMMYIIIPFYLIMGLRFVWYWAIGNRMQSFIPEHLRTKSTAYNILILVNVIAAFAPILAMFFMFDMMMDIIAAEVEPDDFPMELIWVYVIQYGSYFVSFGVSIYTMYYCSKVYKTAVLRRKVTLGDHIGEFFAAWFLFVGIWIMQPKINKLINGTLHPDDYANASKHLIE